MCLLGLHLGLQKQDLKQYLKIGLELNKYA